MWAGVVMQDVMEADTALRDALGAVNRERLADDTSSAYWSAYTVAEEKEKALRNALKALPKPDRDVFVAMYQTLRRWAYEDVGGVT